ncbi:MAG: site-specific integrase [Alphaproteobacteria bacterium]|nr:site-specific integrase [Alphaproteobacteria bacterium]
MKKTSEKMLSKVSKNIKNEVSQSKKNKEFLFTDILISELPFKDKRYEVTDRKCPYLKCRVGSTTKSYVVVKKNLGAPLYVTIGKTNEIPIELARKRAFDLLNKLSMGINPNVEKHKIRNEMTFKELYEDFMNKYASVHVSKSTYKNEESVHRRFFYVFDNKQISQISPREVTLVFNKIYNECGKYVANRALTYFKQLYNKAIEWGWEGFNPGRGLKKFKEEARDRFLLPEEFGAFFKSLEKETNPIFRTFFYALLYTGQRKSNVLEMRWENIDFVSNIWYIPKTKNGTSMRVPLVSQLVDELKKIQGMFHNSPWVFPMNDDPSRHLVNPKKHWKALLQRAKLKDLRIHDLRRTMGSYECMNGVNLSVVSKTLNHKTLQATQVYARVDTSVVLDAMQLTVDKYQEFMNIKK